MADNEGSRVLHVDADAMVVYAGENGIHEDKENLEDYSFVEAHYPYLKRKYEEDNSEKNSESDALKLLHIKKFQRRENFSDAEKCDLVDVICSEELQHDEEVCEKFIIRLRSRTTPNKFKKVLYEQIAAKLETRGYRRRDSVSIKRMWNQLFGDYQKAVNFLNTKAGMNGFKHKPWIMKIYETVKENNLPDHLFMDTDADETETDNNDLGADHIKYEEYNDDCMSIEHPNEGESERVTDRLQQRTELEVETKPAQRKLIKSGMKLTTSHSLSSLGTSSKVTTSQGTSSKVTTRHKNIQCEITPSKPRLSEPFKKSLEMQGIDQLAAAVLEISRSSSGQKVDEMKLLLDCYVQEKAKDRELEREKLGLEKTKEEHHFIIDKLKMDFALKFGCFPTAGIPNQN